MAHSALLDSTRQILLTNMDQLKQVQRDLQTLLTLRIDQAEEAVHGTVSEEGNVTQHGFTIASQIDELLSVSNQFHNALSCMNICEMDNTQDTSTLNSAERANREDPYYTTRGSNSQENVHSRLSEVETKLQLLEKLQSASAEKITQVESKINAVEKESALKDTLLEELGDNLTKSSQQVDKFIKIARVNRNSITRLDKTMEVQSEKIILLEKKDTSITFLQNVLNQLHLKVEKRQELAERMTGLTTELMQHMVEVREAVSNEVTGVHEELTQRMSEIRSELSSVETALALTVDIQDKGTEMMPAFSATVASFQVVRPGDAILFSQTFLNKWDCYDAQISRFTSPASGVYFFSISLNSNSSRMLTAAIVHNGNKTSLCGCPASKDAQTGTSVVLLLCTGDQVWVTAESQTDVSGVEIGAGFSCFAGVRLQ